MKPLKVYACYNTDDEVRLNSSSGGVFTALAEYVLSKQGIVYGVAMSEDCYSAEFISVTNRRSLARLRGSKYLQAKVGNTYKLVKDDLISGKSVLFTGTGCQVNGLKKFLGKEYDNLICVDLICHGVPSPALWRKYAAYKEEKNGGKLININFRCKDDSWINFGMKEILDGIPKEAVKSLYLSKDEDSYMKMFFRDYCLRPSCYECVAKKVKLSDLTIADFGGIDDVLPSMNDGMGTSLVLIRTDKGKEFIGIISSHMKLREVSYEDGVKGNPAEFKSCARPPQRNTFFEDMYSMDFEEFEKKYTAPIKVSLYTRIKRKIKSTIKCLLVKFGGGQSIKVMRNMDYSLCFVFDCKEKSDNERTANII